MTAAGRPDRDASQRDGLSIGAVLAQLRGDFPDVTISKIRFLEAEGLVQPGRTPSGYRQFAPADVERLRFVLSAQRDHYLPLKVIKEQLDAADQGAAPSAVGPKPPRKLVSLEAPGENGGLPSPGDFETDRELRLTEEDLLRQAGIDAATLAELRQYGLVRPGVAGFFDPDAVLVAKTVKAMTEFGIEPRHLRAFRAAADREVGLLEQIVTPVYRHRDEDAQARGDEVVRELAALTVALHTLLVKAGIRAVTGG
ncbi:MerR family transcriptional regulator [Amycolatopsis regifaucium]|uniref:MerR family transcriptional regulator n=1 Tax=Amycolatopsis regifaucium TaxID=546365 RepID=A0A154MWQ0_9PSEU|nr:MerR family transcriptional regulator [Amycolatopsis regifaucium]KZB88177.1 MerR family transcriptional regulator [Amycolatopsis regifaucium]OKA04322.1 MerR family transcriptional regulator [Amycolatopsis regifaucium]SFH46574.1 MerR family regulatory protein [Amycolatopsis regifaucium]